MISAKEIEECRDRLAKEHYLSGGSDGDDTSFIEGFDAALKIGEAIGKIKAYTRINDEILSWTSYPLNHADAAESEARRLLRGDG